MKEPLYKIGEAARLLELETYVLRFWETEFPQLEPLRTPKGQRLYSAQHLNLLREVKRLLYDEGLTIDGARKALERRERDPASPPLAGEHAAEPRTAPPVPGKAPRPTLVQGSLIPGVPGAHPATPAPDRQLLLELRGELLALREALRALPQTASPVAPRSAPSPADPIPSGDAP